MNIQDPSWLPLPPNHYSPAGSMKNTTTFMFPGQWFVTRSCSREVTIGVPFSVVYFSRGTLPPKKRGKRALLGDLG